MHFWSVWHEGRDFDHYRDVRPRFCSEFGFQSYPSMDVIRTFAEPEDLNIASPGDGEPPEERRRQRPHRRDDVPLLPLPRGLRELRLALARSSRASRSRPPSTTGAASSRIAWARSTGSSTTPGRSRSWSLLDYGGGWKLLHHMAQRFFAPGDGRGHPRAGGLPHRGRQRHRPTRSRSTVDRSTPPPWTAPPARSAPRRRTVGTDAAATLHRAPAGALGEPARSSPAAGTPRTAPRGGDVFAPRPLEGLDLPRPEASPSATAIERRTRSSPPSSAEALALFVTARGRPCPAASRPTPSRSSPAARPRSPSPPHDGDPAAVTLTAPRPLVERRQPPDRGPPHDRLLLPALQLAQLPAARRTRSRMLSQTLGYKAVEGYGALYADDAKVAELKAASRRQRPHHADRPFRPRHARERPRRACSRSPARSASRRSTARTSPPDQRPDTGKGCDGLRQAAAEGRPRPSATPGLGFGWHNHDFEFETLPDGAAAAGRDLRGRPRPRMGSRHRLGDHAAAPTRLQLDQRPSAPRITAVHVKDIAPAGRERRRGRLGRRRPGHRRLEAHHGGARRPRRVKYFVIEHDNPSDDRALRRALARRRQAL